MGAQHPFILSLVCLLPLAADCEAQSPNGVSSASQSPPLIDPKSAATEGARLEQELNAPNHKLIVPRNPDALTPRTRIYFVQAEYERYASRLSEWFPGIQDVFNYSRQSEAIMPERPNGQIAEIKVDNSQNLMTFLGNDYDRLLSVLARREK